MCCKLWATVLTTHVFFSILKPWYKDAIIQNGYPVVIWYNFGKWDGEWPACGWVAYLKWWCSIAIYWLNNCLGPTKNIMRSWGVLSDFTSQSSKFPTHQMPAKLDSTVCTVNRVGLVLSWIAKLYPLNHLVQWNLQLGTRYCCNPFSVLFSMNAQVMIFS